MKLGSQHSWILLFLVGLLIAYFAYDNLVVIPGLDPADPERGWRWLTTDPKVIEYIKFWFRNFGYWVLAVAVFVMAISATGFRKVVQRRAGWGGVIAGGQTRSGLSVIRRIHSPAAGAFSRADRDSRPMTTGLTQV